MKKLVYKHKNFWSQSDNFLSSFVASIFFIISMFVNYFSVKLALKDAGNSTTDILLQNLPVVNTDIIFSEGALLFVLFLIFLFMLKPNIIPYTLKSIALFICVRAVFVIMTHLAPPTGAITTDFGNLGYVSLGADLFFSGHTGLPFLMALIFWQNYILKYVFLAASIIAGIAVILGHLHYTIDVFSAFFITHGIYLISKKYFQKDYQLFLSENF